MFTGKSGSKVNDFPGPSFKSSLRWIQGEGSGFLLKSGRRMESPRYLQQGWLAPLTSNPPGERKATPSLLHPNDFILTPGLYFTLLPIHYFNYDFLPFPGQPNLSDFAFRLGYFGNSLNAGVTCSLLENENNSVAVPRERLPGELPELSSGLTA